MISLRTSITFVSLPATSIRHRLDFDGGFGLHLPPEIDTVADLPKVAALMRRRGYSDQDAENILGRNWLRLLSTSLRG
jgi:microsomal dipeptidase-like Zn-dependent dipeptidase